MKTTVYIDAVLVLNGLVNYFLLRAAVRLTDIPFARWRLGVAALFGGAYAVVVYLPPMGFLSSLLGKLLCALAMAGIAAGGLPWRSLMRFTAVFWGVSFALGGCVLALSFLTGYGALVNGVPVLPVHFPTLLAACGVCYLLFTLVFRRMARHGGLNRDIVPMEICWRDRSVTVPVLLDTGNTLRDPLSGACVLIAEWDRLRPLLPPPLRALLTQNALHNPVGLLETLLAEGLAEGFRLIPYRAVGVPGGFLLAFRPTRIIENGKPKHNILVAFSPNALSDGAPFAALIGV